MTASPLVLIAQLLLYPLPTIATIEPRTQANDLANNGLIPSMAFAKTLTNAGRCHSRALEGARAALR